MQWIQMDLSSTHIIISIIVNWWRGSGYTRLNMVLRMNVPPTTITILMRFAQIPWNTHNFCSIFTISSAVFIRKILMNCVCIRNKLQQFPSRTKSNSIYIFFHSINKTGWFVRAVLCFYRSSYFTHIRTSYTIYMFY